MLDMTEEDNTLSSYHSKRKEKFFTWMRHNHKELMIASRYFSLHLIIKKKKKRGIYHSVQFCLCAHMDHYLFLDCYSSYMFQIDSKYLNYRRLIFLSFNFAKEIKIILRIFSIQNKNKTLLTLDIFFPH